MPRTADRKTSAVACDTTVTTSIHLTPPAVVPNNPGLLPAPLSNTLSDSMCSRVDFESVG
jgi:hypothetical protein